MNFDSFELPPVTKCILLSTVLMASLVSLDIVNPMNLCFSWNMIFYEYEIWRLVTCFLFAGPFGLHFLFNTYVLIRYCAALEEGYFYGKPGDFVWMLLVCGIFLLYGSYLVTGNNTPVYFFAGGLTTMMTYIWGRRNPHARMRIIMFVVPAPYIGWIIVLLTLLLGGRVSVHIVGLIVGHMYYFFEDIYPHMPTSKGLRVLSTPKIMKKLFRQRF
eukprot:GHVR01050915.1.p1 GENE.GHVR01050915.1~~GHVR01050915.1.p1  ORF type:complete len:215 (+),score=22.72 GHVR01050915.1:26-670(+)